MLSTTSACKKFICCLIPLMAGCSSPEIRLDQEAQHLNFKRAVIQGTEFEHVVYINNAQNQITELHVYLDGDGMPWINNRRISENPTPRNPLLLRLMSLDTAPAVYLGRPCYHGFSDTPPCHPGLWTDQRYSTTIVKTMAVALKQMLKQLNKRRAVLIGYSGGGTLAMLLAEHIKNIKSIVTVAGNLDIEAWSHLHGYSTLTGSLNPARKPPLDATLIQWHYAGGKDRNIPVSLIKSTVLRQHSAQLIVIPEFDHTCCWEKIWPSVLQNIQLDVNDPESSATIKKAGTAYGGR